MARRASNTTAERKAAQPKPGCSSAFLTYGARLRLWGADCSPRGRRLARPDSVSKIHTLEPLVRATQEGVSYSLRRGTAPVEARRRVDNRSKRMVGYPLRPPPVALLRGAGPATAARTLTSEE
jgi:hypothetical protein